jgi:hypothetical protein
MHNLRIISSCIVDARVEFLLCALLYSQEPELPELPTAPQQEAEEVLNLPAAPAMKT